MDVRSNDLLKLIHAVEPYDETTLYAAVYIAQKWGLLPEHYSFEFSTNLPFSSEMTEVYRKLLKERRVIDRS